jgi:HAE1 family hydrophobic/amphiphilic exporter-1
VLNRDKAKQLGLSLTDVFTTMQVFLGSLYINDFNLFGRTFRVIVQAEGRDRADQLDFAKIFVPTAGGGVLPLDAVGKLEPMTGPPTVPHYNLYGSAQITGEPAAGYSSSQAVAAMQRAAATALPEGFDYDWTGVIYQQLQAGSVALLIFGLAFVFVFLSLAVMLIGLSAKNAILIVEFAKRLREEGKPVLEAAMEAARLRLRPILMTAFAFILGVSPLVLAGGAGAASRQSLGTVVFGGMLAATVLGLVFTPVFYVTIERLRERRTAATRSGEAPASQPAE